MALTKAHKSATGYDAYNAALSFVSKAFLNAECSHRATERRGRGVEAIHRVLWGERHSCSHWASLHPITAKSTNFRIQGLLHTQCPGLGLWRPLLRSCKRLSGSFWSPYGLSVCSLVCYLTHTLVRKKTAFNAISSPFERSIWTQTTLSKTICISHKKTFSK